jgi:hypothetical protein
MDKKNKDKRKNSPELMASAARCLQAPSKMRFPPSSMPPKKRIGDGVKGETAASDDVAPALARVAVKQDYFEGGSVEESSREVVARGRRRSGG